MADDHPDNFVELFQMMYRFYNKGTQVMDLSKFMDTIKMRPDLWKDFGNIIFNPDHIHVWRAFVDFSEYRLKVEKLLMQYFESERRDSNHMFAYKLVTGTPGSAYYKDPDYYHHEK